MGIRHLAAALALALSIAPAGAHDQVPGPSQARPVALVGATVHPVSSPAVPGATVLFEAGRITAVGRDVAVPEGAERIDAAGLHVYPGLINASTGLGLSEIGSIQATVDLDEMGRINPNARVEVALNPDSEQLPVARSNGIALALAVPRGELLAGTSALIRLDGWTPEALTLKAPVGMHLSWPRMALEGREEARRTQREHRDRMLAELDDAFEAARAYLAAGGRAERDARWEALGPVLEGALPLFVHAESADQIRAALAFTARQKVRMVLVGGAEAPECAEALRERKVPVVVPEIFRLPRRADEAYDAPFTLPERLRKAGMAFCIATSDVWNARNLPYHAALASAYGLPREEALAAVTRYPAEILGVADRVGTLEPGKDATLIVTTGDPLEIPTQVKMMFIEGRRVDLQDKQKRLFEKYRARPR